MNPTKTQRNIFSKSIAAFLLLSVAFPSGVPFAAMAQVADSGVQASSTESILKEASSAPTLVGTSTTAVSSSSQISGISSTITFSIPNIVIGTSTIPDLSRVDWDQTINVKGEQVALSSKVALDALSIPDDIKHLVAGYQTDITAIDGRTSLSVAEKAEKKLHEKQALQHLVAEKLIANGTLPANYFALQARGAIESADNIINIAHVPQKKLKATDGVGSGKISDGLLVNGKGAGISASNSSAIKSVRDAEAWRKYYGDRLQYLQARKNVSPQIINEAQHAQDKFENYLLQQKYIDQPNGAIATPVVSFGGIMKWLFGWLLPEKAYAFLFGAEDFESCGSLPCSFTTSTSWGSVAPSIDSTNKIDGAKSLKAVVSGEGSGSVKKTGLDSSDLRVQFKIKVPNPVTFGASGFFTILTLKDGSGNDRLWLNVEDYGTPRLTVTGNVLAYTDTGVDIVPGTVNTIEVRAKTGASSGTIQIWVNNNTAGSPSYDGGAMNIGTVNFDGVVAGLVYAPEGGVSTTYFDDITVNDAFIGASANGTLSGPSTSTMNGLAYILNHQNPDGSWGSATTTFVTTAASLDALYLLHATGTAYTNGISWLDSYIAGNNDYLAEQSRLVAQAGGATTTIQTLIYGLDETTGGFIFDRGYGPDPATTAKALQALTAAGYTDSGDNPDLTVSMALYYLTQTQRTDGTWSSFQGGAGSIPATEEVIQSLVPYRNSVLTGLSSGDITIGDYLTSAIGALRNTQNASGTWGNGALDTALALYSMRSANAAPTYQNNAVRYLENAQGTDGSFGSGDLYITAKAVAALAVTPLAGAIGDPVITDITPLTSLQTNASASIQISITNNGSSTINSGVLQVMADNYTIASIDLAAQNIAINPSSTTQVTLQIPSTAGFVGDVKFTAFIEGADGVGYPNSRYDETLTFSADPTGLPGLPIYFIAQKTVASSSPAMNVRWAYKDDSNRSGFLFMWRNVGSSTWNTYLANSTSSGFFIWPFTEDQHYEVTVGAVAQDGTRYVYYNNPVEVVTSANSTKYATSTVSGSVSVAGEPLASIPLFGYSVDGTSDANGNFSIGNIRYGASAFHVDDFRYEPFWTRFAASSTDLSGIKVPTLLRPDTADPTVTDLAPMFFTGYQVPNKTSLSFHYTVNDDIGNGTYGFVQSAKFEYYDPNDTQWHLIGTQEGLIFSTWTYNWTIPGNLLGTGYELRVTVRDFSGKESTPATYGPFEITAGNGAPTFSFTPPGAGSGSQADLSYTIKWTAHDDEDNATISLVYDVDQNVNNGNSVTIATRHSGDFLTQYDWDTSGIADGTYYVRAIVSDSYNTGVVVDAPSPVTITHHAPAAPTTLYTEGVTNPTNVFDATPRFSAVYNDPESTDTAAYYEIQVATSTTFTGFGIAPFWDSGEAQFPSAVAQGSRLPDIAYSGPTLATSTTYYWRIKLWDSENNEGAWNGTASTFSITDLNSAPTEPTGLLTDGQTNPTSVTSTAPKFSAVYNDPNGGDRANKYRIQVSTSSAFSSVFWDSATTTMATTTAGSRSPDITYAGPTLPTNTTFYWRASFVDVGGVSGAWSTATSTFIIPDLYGFQVDTGGTLTNNLVSYYKLENISDAWGTHDLTNNGSVAFNSAKVNSGADSGSSPSGKYLEVGSNLGVSGGAITIAAWARHTASYGASVQQTIAYQVDDSTHVGYNITFGTDSSGNERVGFARARHGIAEDFAYSNQTLGTAYYHFVALTYDGTTLKGYLDNSLVVSVSRSGNGSGGTSGNRFDIMKELTDNLYQFEGRVDEVGVWSRTLNTTEISDLYNGGAGQTFNNGSWPYITSLNQYRLNGTTAISEGSSTPETGVKLSALLQSSSTSASLELQIELSTTTFLGVPTATSTAVLPGQTATITISNLLDGSYKWQARVLDRTHQIASAWQEFGTAGNTDFVVLSAKQFQVDTGGTLTNGLLRYYKLENTSDFISSSTLTNNGSVAFNSAKVNNGADSGSSPSGKYLEIGSNLGVSGGAITIAAWAKHTASYGANAQQTVAYQVDDGSHVGYNIIFGTDSSGNERVGFARARHGIAEDFAYNNQTLGTSNFHFVVLTYDGTTLKGYVDNSLVVSVARSGSGSGGTSGNRFDIMKELTDNLYQFEGLVDEVGVWNRALTTTEISDLYNSGSGQTMQ